MITEALPHREMPDVIHQTLRIPARRGEPCHHADDSTRGPHALFRCRRISRPHRRIERDSGKPLSRERPGLFAFRFTGRYRAGPPCSSSFPADGVCILPTAEVAVLPAP